ncbi:MAG: DUF4339 domain-containing protein [Verrucomicrobiae bacterium]|nr:DUF4339 domain-containing protein [Verrucomicrobiae bacterium]MDW8308621.1 DUF4339 domain-containing protein [Verrucomicrobiales bacterium]
MKPTTLRGLEINPKMVGAIFTDASEDALRVFCIYINGDTHEFELPIEDNRESLHALYAQLDMLDKCDSAIVESVVQGRVYAQDDKTCWMYTVLATSGSCAPDVRSNIHHLPWKRLWTAKGTEVLQLGRRGRGNYCYAVRTEITDEDLRQTLKRARAFLNPVPPSIRSPAPTVTLAALLALAAILAGGTLWYHLRNDRPAEIRARAAPAAQPTAPAAQNHEARYYWLDNGQIQGPLSWSTLREWQRTGRLKPDSLLRAEGELDWRRFEDLWRDREASATAPVRGQEARAAAIPLKP